MSHYDTTLHSLDELASLYATGHFLTASHPCANGHTWESCGDEECCRYCTARRPKPSLADWHAGLAASYPYVAACLSHDWECTDSPYETRCVCRKCGKVDITSK